MAPHRKSAQGASAAKEQRPLSSSANSPHLAVIAYDGDGITIIALFSNTLTNLVINERSYRLVSEMRHPWIGLLGARPLDTVERKTALS